MISRGEAIVAAVLLGLFGTAALLYGGALWAVSGCCGSREPANTTPLVVGAVVAVGCLVAAVAVWKCPRKD